MQLTASFVAGLIACSLSFFVLANCHGSERRLEGTSAAVGTLPDAARHEDSTIIHDEIDARSSISKRDPFNYQPMSSSDLATLQQAFADMVELVNVVLQHPNAGVLNRYFDPNHQADVTAIFDTIQKMAQQGGFPDPPTSFYPTNLNQIRLLRGGWSKDTLAQSFDVSVTFTAPKNSRIFVYDFGWGALYKRLSGDIDCDCDIKRTNYKMYFLGSVLLHEVLHFNSVPNLAWALPPRQPLLINEVIDDQPGRFMNQDVAYGPYQAMLLRQRDPGAARINNENYVWYALETYWSHRCPNAPKDARGMFQAPQSNEILRSCLQALKGWCWRL